MSLNANAIVTLAEAKTQLNVVDSGMDATLETWINESSNVVEEYTERKIVSQAVTEYHDGDGSHYLYPEYYPIVQLSSASTPSDSDKLGALQYRTSPDSSWTNIETDVDHIFVDLIRPYIELYDTIFPVGKRNIKLVYKAGYATVPSEIKKVVLEMVQMVYNEHKGGGDSLGKSNSTNSQAGGNFNTSWIDMDSRWKKVLDRYRVPSL
jgi:hypothetical protein